MSVRQRFLRGESARAAMVGILMIMLGSQGQLAAADEGEFVGYGTNGPAVYAAYVRSNVPAPLNGAKPVQPVFTNLTFDHFLPDSLNHHVWTSFIANTNGRTMQIWEARAHPEDWPSNPPSVKWNDKSILWGMKGMTALSPCWQDEGNSGQVPITALTRRHGYTRGHGMGPDGFNDRRDGRKIWFLTRDNHLVQMKVIRCVVRTTPNGRRDYTILLFDRDLPPSIEPLSVTSWTNMLAHYPTRPHAPWPIFKTEQLGKVSADVPGFTVNTWKGGDSGSPNMLPLPGQLVFVSGRSTSGPSPEMQADMDELCRQAKLDPRKYQMRWVDLSEFPTY